MRIEYQPDNSHPFSLKNLTRWELEAMQEAMIEFAWGTTEHTLAVRLRDALLWLDKYPDSRIL